MIAEQEGIENLGQVLGSQALVKDGPLIGRAWLDGSVMGPVFPRLLDDAQKGEAGRGDRSDRELFGLKGGQERGKGPRGKTQFWRN